MIRLADFLRIVIVIDFLIATALIFSGANKRAAAFALLAGIAGTLYVNLLETKDRS